MLYILTHHTSSLSSVRSSKEEANVSFWMFSSKKTKLGFKWVFLAASTKWTQQKDQPGYLQSNEKSLFSFLIQGENNFKVDFTIFAEQQDSSGCQTHTLALSPFLLFPWGRKSVSKNLQTLASSFKLKVPTYLNMLYGLFSNRSLEWTSLEPVGASQGTFPLAWGHHPHHIRLAPWSAKCKSSTEETRGEMETKSGSKQH